MRNRILFLFVACGMIASASAQTLNRFTYNVGGGLGIGRDDVASFVGNSPNGVAGFGMNLSHLFGVDAEYMYYDLNFRPSVKESQFLANQSGRMQSISVDGIVTVPKHFRKWGAYGIFGVGFYRRSVSVPKHILPGSPSGSGTAVYEPAYRWWDLNRDIFGKITQQYISSNSKDAGGFNFGGGLTHPINHLGRANIYIEGRYHRAYQSDGQTIVFPITVGLRW